MKTFTQTSDQPYTRHHYKIVATDGQHVIVDNYYDVMRTWMSTPLGILSHVEVLDSNILLQ